MVDTSKDRVRLTIDLTKQLYLRLEDLEKASGFTSKAEVLREALRVYEYLVQRNAEGYNISLEKNGERERVYPFR